MRGLPSILSLFRNKFNKFNNTRLVKSTNVRFYLSFDIKITLRSLFCCKNVIILYFVRNVVMDVITLRENL